MSSLSLSPFIQHISECKNRMRKLRKKIYKHKLNQTDKKSIVKHQTDKKSIVKNHDISSILMNIFKKRNIPTSIITSMKNKRNIDIFNLKSLVIGIQSNLKWDKQTLKEKTNTQEKQIQILYKQHCQRINQLKKNTNNQNSNVKLARRNYISSTQIDYDSNQDSYSNSISDSQINNNNDHQSNNQDSHPNSIFQNYLSRQTPSKQEIQAFIQIGQKQSSYFQGENLFSF